VCPPSPELRRECAQARPSALLNHCCSRTIFFLPQCRGDMRCSSLRSVRAMGLGHCRGSRLESQGVLLLLGQVHGSIGFADMVRAQLSSALKQRWADDACRVAAVLIQHSTDIVQAERTLGRIAKAMARATQGARAERATSRFQVD